MHYSIIFTMILRIFLIIVPLVYSQRTLYPYPPGGVTWDPMMNGPEGQYMQYAEDWKREIVSWAEQCIIEIKNKIFQLDQINWAAADDLRHMIGQTVGRILELQRQQMEMYRRIKRRFENRFYWIRPELAGKYYNMEVDGAVEPLPGQEPPGDFGYPWKKTGPNFNDYKPHVYIVALEYITKKEADIEHLVKLLTNFVGEEEVARFKPRFLPVDQDVPGVWAGYSTYRARTDARRLGPVEDPAEKKEEEYKAKMRADYYKKRGNNNEQ